jgi:hypothetical protein
MQCGYIAKKRIKYYLFISSCSAEIGADNFEADTGVLPLEFADVPLSFSVTVLRLSEVAALITLLDVSPFSSCAKTNINHNITYVTQS